MPRNEKLPAISSSIRDALKGRRPLTGAIHAFRSFTKTAREHVKGRPRTLRGAGANRDLPRPANVH